jgi:Thyroglobulin type-1 repeat
VGKACEAQNATHNGLIFHSATPCSCCETCLANLKEGEYCSQGLPGAPMPTAICGNGLYCNIKHDNQQPTCEHMLETSECFQMKRKFDDDLRDGLIGHLQQTPLCDDDGKFAPISCIPGQNCFCLNENGDRIFGDSLYQKNIEHIMHCGCSRLNDKLKDLVEQRFPFFTTRCKSDGSFDALQCFGDLCVCIDERTGSPTSDTKNLTITVSGLRDLPCYDEKIHLDEFNYARPCENIKRGLINTIFESKREGFIDAEVHIDICDPDGTFKPVQENDLSRYCVDWHNERIEDFVVAKNTTDAETMDCKCARARKLLMDGNYLEIPECCPNGNYKSLACRRGFCYCVDANGKQVSVEVLDIHRNKLPCFKNVCDYIK